MADAMVEVATCPTCLLVRVGERLLQCQAGHLTCCPCYNLLASRPRRCPTANCPFDAPPRRQLAVEDWAGRTATPLPCRWEVEGCDTLLTREEREAHQDACPYRGDREPQQPVVEVPQPHGPSLPGVTQLFLMTIHLILTALGIFNQLFGIMTGIQPDRADRVEALRLVFLDLGQPLLFMIVLAFIMLAVISTDLFLLPYIICYFFANYPCLFFIAFISVQWNRNLYEFFIKFSLFGVWYFERGPYLLPGPTLLLAHIGLNLCTRPAYRRRRWEAVLGAIRG